MMITEGLVFDTSRKARPARGMPLCLSSLGAEEREHAADDMKDSELFASQLRKTLKAMSSKELPDLTFSLN